MNMRGPRNEPCGTPQVRGHDWDDAFVVLTEKEREEIEMNPEESSVGKTQRGNRNS